MNLKIEFLRSTFLAVLSALSLPFSVLGQGTAFNYNCYLTQNGSVLNGRYDLQFALFDANTGGTQLGGTLTTTAASVNSGLYTALLDFGSGIFNGQPRWLQVGIRPSGTGTYTLLARQPLTPTPYAIFAGTSGAGGGNQWLSSGTSIYYNGGNVGVGTSNPSRALEVVSPSGDAEIGVRSGDANGRLWTIQSSRTTEGDNLDGTFQVIDRTAGKSRLRISPGGNVSIDAELYVGGYVSVDSDLHVARGVIANTLATVYDIGSANGTVSGHNLFAARNVTCNGYYYCWFDDAYWALDKGGANNAYWSDRRLKRDITTLANATQALGKLRGVSYFWNEAGLQHLTGDIEKKWKSRSGKPEDDEKLWQKKRREEYERLSKLQMGFVAQEVEQLFPDWVTTDRTGYKRVNMEHLNALLVNAVNEQQGEIIALGKQLAAQTVLADRMEARFGALEKANAELHRELAARNHLISLMEGRLGQLERSLTCMAALFPSE